MTQPSHPTDTEIGNADLLDAQDMCIEVAGRAAEFWGFTRTMGRVYCALFLSPSSMTQADLVQRLGISAANVSMSLKGLLRWGAVHRTFESGGRKMLYTAEPELRTVVRNIIGGREQSTLQRATADLKEALELVQTQKRSGVVPTPDEDVVIERIQHLESAARLSNRLIGMLLGHGRVDVHAELDILDGPKEPQGQREYLQ